MDGIGSGRVASVRKLITQCRVVKSGPLGPTVNVSSPHMMKAFVDV